MTDDLRTFPRFIRDYVDDIIRLVTLAALFGVIVSSLKGVSALWYAAPVFVGLLTAALFLTTFAIVEYLAQHVTTKTPAILVAFVLPLNLAASMCVFYTVLAVVAKALSP